MLNHTDLNTNLNTDELCEVYFSFLAFNGLEGLDEVSADELRQHIICNNDNQPNEMTEWLERFMLCWWHTCDAESSIGHAIQPYHGYFPDMTESELKEKAQF